MPKWADWVLKVLSALVIPLALWGVTLEVNSAVQDEKIAKLEAAVEDVKPMTASMARVEEKIDATNKRLDEIKADLRRSLPPGP